MREDFDFCVLNTIRETEKYIVVEKKQVLKIGNGNIAISTENEHLFEIYDFRTGLKISTLSVHKNFVVDSLFEFFENFEVFTKDIVNERDFLLKKFISIKVNNLSCGYCMHFSTEEFEQFLLENQP